MAAVQPSNNSELQLYRVLQRANLLQYFETFITQGGDDVQQLCEAGEDEFLEIMALVGMASKPLHVRRLQKALQEWVANPAAFEGAKKFPTHVMSMTGSSSQSVSPTHPLERSGNLQDYKVTPPQSSAISTSTTWSSQLGGARGVSPSEGSNLEDPSSSNSPPHEYKEVIKEDYKEAIKDTMYNHEDSSYSFANMPQPILQEHQITAIASAAAMLAQDLPPFEPKSMPKKQISKEISAVMLMSQDDPNRMDALRKYAAIYGRFDSKRKNDRPMSLHEISVNEAAAQLCHHFPALLTRREELFPLARQVVRDSGYQYSKGHSRYGADGAAEVLVSPQLEQDSLQTSPGPAGQQTSKADSFNELQNELTQITLELSEMNKEQDRIRSALRVLLEANDHEQMKGLTAEMDDLNDRHAALTKRRQRIVNIIARYRKGNSKYSVPGGTSSKSSSKHSPSNGQSAVKANNNNSKFNNNYGSFTDDTVPANPLNTLYMAAMHKDSLFEEGLRIAQQYGMSDFAQELIGLKKSSTNEGTEEKSDSGVNVSSESNSRSSAFTSYSSSSTSTPFVPSSVEAVSSSMYVAAGNGQCIQSTPLTLSSVSSCAGHGSGMISATKYSTSSTGAEKTKPMPMSKKQYHLQGHKNSTPNPSSSPSISESSHLSNDESMDVSSVDNNNTMKSSNAFDRQDSTATTTSESTIAQGSTTTTTTITTKSGQVIEVETRRSSRRKNGEPDYYLINGGEKRFRSGNSRRSSSTSSERARRLSSSSSTSSITPATPTSISPVKQPNKSDSPANGDNIIRMNVTELRFRNGADVQKVILDVNQMCDSEDHVDISSAGGNEDNSDMDKRAVRKKGRPPSYTGQKVLMSEDIH